MTHTDPPAPERPSDLLDQVREGLLVVDGDRRVTYCNERAAALLGVDRDSLEGAGLQKDDGDAPEGLREALGPPSSRAMTDGERSSFEAYHEPTGAWLHGDAVPDGDRVTIRCRDVSDRRRLEAERNTHAAVVGALQDAVVTVREDGTIDGVNKALELSLGLTRTDVVGEDPAVFERTGRLSGEDVDRIESTLRTLLDGDAMEDGVQVRFRDVEGRERLADLQFVRLAEGADAAVAVIARDVTERERYEQIVRSLHTVSRQLFQTDDPEVICSLATHTASELLDLPLTGVYTLERDVNRLVPVAATAAAHEELGGLPQFDEGDGVVWSAYRDGDPVVYDDVRSVDGERGEHAPIRSEIVAPLGSHGVLLTADTEAAAFDETDLELAKILAANTEAALDRADRLQLLQERKGELERNSERLEAVETVLSSNVRDHLDEAASALAGAEVADSDDARESVLLASVLVDDLLELTRGKAWVGPRADVDLERAVAAATDDISGANVSASVNDDAALRADSDRFVRLLAALVEDLGSRTGDDGPAVEVGVVDAEPADPRLPERERTGSPEGFFVRAPSASMTEAERETAFAPEAADGGEGLGLAVAERIAEAHGWELDVAASDADVRYEVRDVTTLTRDGE